MKALGIIMVGLLAVAGGITAAALITKKKLEKANEEDYYDDWDMDEDEWDDMDFDFDEDADITAEEPAEPEVSKQNEELIEETPAEEPSEEL